VLPSFVSREEAADAILSAIVSSRNAPAFTIDRLSARELVANGKGGYTKCIISQMTFAWNGYSVSQLQCKDPIWKVTFLGEPALDYGGPARELLTEAASSIFEPSSRLVVKSPNNRRGAGGHRDTFVPFDTTGMRINDYCTIGHLLGIVLRSGLTQDLPFAPIVWKYLAGEKIVKDDILAVDDELNTLFQRMVDEKEAITGLEWAVEGWDGTPVKLIGHTPGTFVKSSEFDQYVTECIQHRLMSLKPMLKMMRSAFRRNIGLCRFKLLSGGLLSRMVQGLGLITVQLLQSITVYSNYSGVTDPYIARFWKAVSKFSLEQMKLLLKFITGLVRLPSATMNPDFKIQIDRQPAEHPDQALPTVATCFQQLHLPPYSRADICYRKLLYAVKFCQTMENQ
jgi:hypothetical protein